MSAVPVPDAWQPTAHPHIELRPAYGVVPVSGPRPTITGWRVRVPWNASIDGTLPGYQEPHTHPWRIPE